ncbi:flagellar protein FlaG [Mesobacillus jeotgali]|uniref:Flagellar protein FlaG n=1 Tax=Mesobacillus jeotgali TaxID=129985 RepID=A0ABY9VG75_9BACI|nr:flagellar protein FlaG [Mesobacillus jeotgali]WNF22608.1 flagellar protein FlaG [Mesobacillus jeotgali]
MIERLSSNNFTSQLRNVENIQMQEELVKLPEEENFQKEGQSISRLKVEEVVNKINKFMENSPTSLKFEFHEKLNEYYVKIIDDKTKEIVREIPPKKMLDFYAAMTEFIGLMIDKKI